MTFIKMKFAIINKCHISFRESFIRR